MFQSPCKLRKVVNESCFMFCSRALWWKLHIYQLQAGFPFKCFLIDVLPHKIFVEPKSASKFTMMC